MYIPFGSGVCRNAFEQSNVADVVRGHSGDFDALVALEDIGTRRHFRKGAAIYAEGDVADSWYRIVFGTVRICKLLRDGRRHIAQFYFEGDCFGLPASDTRAGSAEAIGKVIVTRYPRRAADRLINEDARFARELYERTLCELTKRRGGRYCSLA